jgi:hypothetical protein
MKKIIFIIVAIYVFANWTEVSSFVTGNLHVAGTSTTKWLIDHTPKK